MSEEIKDLIADALEDATRVPVQGEPNGDREALADIVRDHFRDVVVYDVVDAILAAGFSRASVPDAATLQKAEAKIADLVYENASLKAERDATTARFECDRDCLAIEEPVEDCSAHGRTPRDLWEQIDKVAAERDAALAAVERVRAAVNRPHLANSGLDSFTLAHISAALDWASEPEVKP